RGETLRAVPVSGEGFVLIGLAVKGGAASARSPWRAKKGMATAIATISKQAATALKNRGRRTRSRNERTARSKVRTAEAAPASGSGASEDERSGAAVESVGLASRESGGSATLTSLRSSRKR